MVHVPEIHSELAALRARPPADRLAPLCALGRRLVDAGLASSEGGPVAAELAGLIEEGVGRPPDRLELGEVLGLLGDPRLVFPEDAAYWIAIEAPDGAMQIGRYPVTNAEFRRFVEAGGYDRRELWTEAGWSWREATSDTWPVKAAGANAGPYIVPNQPVVGVSFHEALAYATWASARRPTFDERLFAVRGEEKRPYPWGSPFGKNNANTREEVHNRPCAVGLYVSDRSPEGVSDLVGNVGEWTDDGLDDERWCHPGSFSESFESSWAKARESRSVDHRAANLGFRLAR